MTATIEPDDELGWALAEEFDRAARDVRREPDSGLLEALAEHGTDEMIGALFDVLEEVCLCPHEAPDKAPDKAPDEAMARHYGAHLDALAALLPEEGRRAVRAVVDLRLGWLCAAPGRWPEARLRAERALPDLVVLLPELVPDLHALLAGVADEDDRLDDARAHWASARDGYAAAQRWGDAACAAEGAAGLCAAFTPAVLGEWQQAAHWYLMAEQPEQARGCAEQACRMLAASWLDLVTGDEPDLRELAEQTRQFALEHGLTVLAAHVRALASSLAMESEESWSQVCQQFDEARTGYAALDLDEADRRLVLARIDMWQGVAASSRGRPTDAEPLFSRALPTLRESGSEQEVQLVEAQLIAIIMPTDGPDALAPAVPGEHWTDGAARGTALFVDGLRRCGAGAMADGAPLLDEAARLYAAAGNAEGAVAMEGFAGAMRALSGDRAAGIAALRRLQAHQGAHGERCTRSGRVLLVAAGGVLRWGLAHVDGDRDGWLGVLERTEADLLEQGARLPASHLAVVRGQDLLQAGRAEEALWVVLPAVLAMDAHRGALPDARRRSLWAARVAAGFDTAYRAAAACGQNRLLAELLEVGRGNAVPTPRPADARDDAMSALGAAFLPEPPGTATSGVRPGAAAAVAGAHRTVLGLAALIRTPWGTVALGEQLRHARRYVDPNRADDTVEWRIRDEES